MNRIISAVAHILASSKWAKPTHGVAGQLMEQAQACAGRGPQEARELRRAASVYLSVVR